MRVEPQALTGRGYLSAIVELARRARLAHPTAGVWESADFEWWWRKPRPTDLGDQLFWFVGDDPVAASICTDWGGRLGLDVVTLPDASPSLIADVFHRGLDRIRSVPVDHIEVMVDVNDVVTVSLLVGACFAELSERGTSAWMSAQQRLGVAPLASGYRLVSRSERRADQHHLAERSGADVERRLRETSMYKPELDLAVVDDAGDVAAYGLFWHDPVTGVGFVEPMGTDECHRRRGLARHVLTIGLGLLAQAGADRLKINYADDNPASSALYKGVGFKAVMTTSMFVRPQECS